MLTVYVLCAVQVLARGVGLREESTSHQVSAPARYPRTVFSPAIFALTILKTDRKTATTTRLPYVSDLTVLFFVRLLENSWILLLFRRS